MEKKGTPVVVIGGVQYDASNAVPEVASLIRDLATVQTELNRLKTSYDITTIARNTLLLEISKSIEAGESGLEKIEQETMTEQETNEEGK